MLQVGTTAPDFSLPDQNGQIRSLSDFRGQKVILYFYPKDMTAGCTKQACAFGELYPQFQEKGAVVIGVRYGKNSHSKLRCLERKENCRQGFYGSCTHDLSDRRKSFLNTPTAIRE